MRRPNSLAASGLVVLGIAMALPLWATDGDEMSLSLIVGSLTLGLAMISLFSNLGPELRMLVTLAGTLNCALALDDSTTSRIVAGVAALLVLVGLEVLSVADIHGSDGTGAARHWAHLSHLVPIAAATALCLAAILWLEDNQLGGDDFLGLAAVAAALAALGAVLGPRLQRVDHVSRTVDSRR